MTRLTLLLVLLLAGCGFHIPIGGNEDRLNDMTIVVHLKDFSGVNKTYSGFVPVYGHTNCYTYKPLPDGLRTPTEDSMGEIWTAERLSSDADCRLPMIRDARGYVWLADCEITSIPDKGVLWEELKHCYGARDLPLPLF